MQYALVNGERQEPQPNLSGNCPLCGDPTIAKCGDIRVWHWSHLKKLTCDPWWENETEWHRSWKGQFPKEWHERIHRAAGGEKHIADVKTDKDWVIEFQYSHLPAEERKARTAFYQKVAWVVSGVRRKKDQEQFFALLRELGSIPNSPIIRRIFLVHPDKSALLRDWGGCTAPVFFDFGGPILWCLLPGDRAGRSYVLEFSRNAFIGLHRDTSQPDLFTNFINDLCAVALEKTKQLEAQSRRLNTPHRY